MTPSPSDAPPAASARRAKTLWIVGGVLLAAAGVFIVANAKRWQFANWAGAADQQEFSKKIQGASDPRMDDALLDTAKDERKATSVRRACASLLVDRNHLREVEDLLVNGSRRSKRIALAALTPRPFFHKQYLADPAYHVREILVDWIGDADDPSADRADALTAILPRVWPYTPRGADPAVPPEILKTVGSILEGPPADDRDAPDLRVAAAGVVTGYRWCAGAPALLAAARKEQDARASLRLMQSLVTLADADGAPCKDVLPEDAVFGVVETTLRRPGTDSISRGARMGALALLERHPAWAKKKVAEIRAILDSDTSPEERGSAFPALVASGDVAARGDVAVWIHDPAYGVRSRVAQAVAAGKAGLESADHMSLLVGYFDRDPQPTDLAFRDVSLRLRSLAGSWVGFPETGPGERGAASGDMGPLLRDLVAGRPVGGKSRADVGAAWWNWLAGKNGIAEGPSLKAAFAARDAFWTKAKAGDVAGARAALDAAPAKDSPLWEYERGWLAAKGRAKAG